MPREERIRVCATFQGRHPRVYTFLCQLIIAIITFYCAIAISRYGPERDPISVSTEPGTVAPRIPLSDANSTTPHICKNGAREDIVDLGAVLITITPYNVLCPSTPFFFVSLVCFVLGIFKFNSLHTEDLDLADGYSLFIISGLPSLDWRNVFVSIQVTMPMMIWSATVLLPIMHWFLKTFFPVIYGRYREMRRLQAETWRKTIEGGGERVGDIESGGEPVEGGDVEEGINEETPWGRDEERTGLDA
ncbi:hypothetical protein BGZ60DRAFT_513759 [Tricladium varicosporioides]|nr:hypothetical protein BGZ60DRAFT_513759 [Hymenoscyphus varicosporioides]